MACVVYDVQIVMKWLPVAQSIMVAEIYITKMIVNNFGKLLWQKMIFTN